MSVTHYQQADSADFSSGHDIERDQNHVCHFVLMELLHTWPEVPDETVSSGLLDHVDQCPGCLKQLIAFEAAVQLANFQTAESSADVGISARMTGL